MHDDTAKQEHCEFTASTSSKQRTLCCLLDMLCVLVGHCGIYSCVPLLPDTVSLGFKLSKTICSSIFKFIEMVFLFLFLSKCKNRAKESYSAFILYNSGKAIPVPFSP